MRRFVCACLTCMSVLGCGTPKLNVQGAALGNGTIGAYARIGKEDSLSPDIDPHGRNWVVITRVDSGGPADAAGIEPGDLLVEVNEKRPETARDAILAIRSLRPGTQISVKIMRGDEEMVLPITVAALDSPSK